MTVNDEGYELNYYGKPIIPASEFDGVHFPASVPLGAAEPPVCSCGWTRWGHDGVWFELVDHIRDMGEYGTLQRF